jgi:hypothetical protein
MTTNCTICKHWTGRGPRCAAFPDQIPLGIWYQQVDHDEPYKGDHDLEFEDAYAEYAEVRAILSAATASA